MSTPTAANTPKHAAFAARLRSARVRTGKSQEQIASEVGTSRRHWIRWEGGWTLPSSVFIAKIAEATGQSTDYLSGTPKPEREEEQSDEDEEADLIRALLRRLIREELARA